MTSYLFNVMAYLSTIPQLTGPNNTVTQYIGGLLDEALVMPYKSLFGYRTDLYINNFH